MLAIELRIVANRKRKNNTNRTIAGTNFQFHKIYDKMQNNKQIFLHNNSKLHTPDFQTLIWDSCESYFSI